MRVLKFGGEALRDGPAVRHAAQLVRTCGGKRPLVVVSAHAGVTAKLERAVEEAFEGRLEWDPVRIRHRTLLRELDLPGELLDRHLTELRAILEALQRGRAEQQADDRFRDFVLSFGERMSARVFSAALRREGIDATPLDATDLGLVKAVGRPGLPEQVPNSLFRALECIEGVPVITGFLALDAEGNLTTLGRNGSDLTAVWFGAAVHADEVQLWKRVPGLMTADPSLVPEARHITRLSFDDANELARHGSGVLHPGSIEPAQRAGAAIHLRDLDDADGPGSRIADLRAPGDQLDGGDSADSVIAIAHRTDVACLSVPIQTDRGNATQLQQLFSSLASSGVEPYLGTIGAGEVELLLTEDRWVERVVESKFPSGRLVRGLATVTLVGGGLDRSPVVRAALAEAAALGAREIRCELTTTSHERSRVLLTSREAVDGLVRMLHRRFFAS